MRSVLNDVMTVTKRRRRTESRLAENRWQRPVSISTARAGQHGVALEAHVVKWIGPDRRGKNSDEEQAGANHRPAF
jgi:hypothetical protein